MAWYRLAEGVKYKVLQDCGAFFYSSQSSESHFYPLDSSTFFTLLSSSATLDQLNAVLLDDFEMSSSESTQIATNTINSLKSVNLVEEFESVPDKQN